MILFSIDIGFTRKKIAELTNVRLRSLRYLMEKEGLTSRCFDQLNDQDLDEEVSKLVLRFPNAGKFSLHSFVALMK